MYAEPLSDLSVTDNQCEQSQLGEDIPVMPQSDKK